MEKLEEKLEEEYLESLSPDVGFCENFIDEMGKEQRVTIVIVPIFVREKDNGFSIAWACNHGKECYRSSCLYARGAES